jgi:predicted negative regulator of RcsB-dependent stress response
MSRKYITVVVLGVLAMVGWNVFLIQRDERMYDAYYRTKAIENLKTPPSNQIR